MSESITAIEAAIVARIKASALGSALKTVDSYQRVLEALRGGQLATPLPAVYVQYTGGQPEKVSQKWKLNCEFTFTVISQNLRNVQAAKTESQTGAYAIIDSILALFAGHQLGLAITPLNPAGVESLNDEDLQKAGLAMYDVRFRTSVVIEPVSDEVLTDLLTMYLNYTLPGETEPRVIGEMTKNKDGI